jgi:uncharacterized protein YcbK (DUF882 family)
MFAHSRNFMSSSLATRRHFIGAGASFLSSLCVPAVTQAALPERRLAFSNPHNGERFDACYFSNGRYRPEGLAELNHALRDWRTGETGHMDPRLLDLLVRIRNRLEVSPGVHFRLISGYRCPSTNRALHGRSSEVAIKSQHLLGKATDIAIPRTNLARLRNAAMSLQGGGVGYYPADGFVHIDTGHVRHWTS